MHNIKENVFSKSIGDYIYLKDDARDTVDSIIKSVKSNSILRVNSYKVKPKELSFWNFSWGEIVLLREAIQLQDLQQVMQLVYGVKAKMFSRINIYNCFAVYKWINEQLKEITDLEVQELGGEVTLEEKEAGVEMLNHFGYSVSVDVLAGGNILKHEEVLAKPYIVIFKKLCLNKAKIEIQKNYAENARKKN
ncbi:hypothetical protein J2Q11_08625 [Tenacibaculum finnmarkense genomovar finnmarkense]|uniref:hypothetical protein n=1 Tax=Tenacibaculum finnmarkense TaxID=2781243 RepID=UPI001EFB8374|nr:hypothetical protein [Tenacibaculum finnmarkense]MCG8212939.1 hypothetical protein [Tenacibaculum finnmarkense genomovar finnmarkense]MCG8231190.1 hypothetical protein [Tenacibaculum finnmarkense genomovar finnmarkense]MCG8884595.1 hypothetical protein [Tenacibaculum finnmarkense]MCG8897175.1 hypothetical protein [Tenacibaculum finnmarkense]MCG8903218.1 hypothetical protein [Tenacibaculum finnmarkense]